MLAPDDLVLCSGTLLQAGLPEMIEAAVAGGFGGITVWPEDVARARARGLDYADMRRLLDDAGLVVADLDCLLTWLPADAERARKEALMQPADEPVFYELAAGLGARSLNLAQGFGQSIDLDEAAEAIAGVADRAREHGLLVTLEFLPWSGVRDAATAWEIVRRSGRENATVLVDTWHHYRGPFDHDQLRAIPPERIGSVQINGAPRVGPGDILRETMEARLLPGEGDLPVAEVIRVLDEMGVTAPIGVETFSKELQALPPAEVGRRAGEAGRRELARARG